MKLYYHGTHLPTRNVWIAPFARSHHTVFSDPKGYGERTLLKAAEDTIARWNRQQPKTWLYRMATEKEVAEHIRQQAV